MPEIKKASCLFCSLQCGFAMEMDAGVPVRVDLDTEAPHNLGSLCTRGHYNLELLVHPKRNLAATVNRRRVPWTTGVTKVAGKLAEIKEAGGDALGVIVGTELSNEDYSTAAAFAKALGTDNIAVAYDGSDYPLLMGGGAGDATPADLDDADCFVLIGDVFWGHPTVAKRIIESRYRSRTNRIYTLNPYRSNTDWFADRHVIVRPGAEPLVLAGLLTAMNVQGAPKVDLDSVAAASDLVTAELNAIAGALKKEHAKVVVVVSSRLGDSASAYLTGQLSAMLAQKVGGKYAPLFRGGNALGAYDAIGSARTVPELLADVTDGKIKGLLVFGPDLLQLYPGAVGTDDLEKLQLLAASAIFENDTTKHSDVGLPQSVWTEMTGTYTGSMGIATTMEPLTDAQGDARSTGEMLKDFAGEMGVALSAGPPAQHPELPIDANAELARIAGQSEGEGVVLIESIHPLHRWDGTITGRMSFPKIVSPYCDVWIGEEAAESLGVEAGSNVALATERGETTIIATVTDRMPGGLVAIPSYVPDVRGLLAWTLNSATKWYDVAASGAKVTPGT